MPDLTLLTDDELRAEAARRGYVLHSVQFSAAAQTAIRELEKVRARADALIAEYHKATTEPTHA